MKQEVLNFFEKYKLFLIGVGLAFLSIVVLQVNYNKNHMHDYTVDEYFTISTIHPNMTPDKTVHRALNGPRLFTYMFYPGAMVGMIGHMGGNIYVDGWKYPGHNYFIKNYKLSGSSLKTNMEDPNLRYFHYYLKLQAIILLFLSLVPVLYLLWKKNLIVGMFMVSILIGINLLSLEERSLFYIEPLLMVMMNVLTWLYLFFADKKQISWFWMILASFLFALTISLKFSALFVIILLIALIISKETNLEMKLRTTILLIFSSIAFFCLINWHLFHSKEVFNNIVHDYFSNFWQYATGNKGVVIENFKLYNLKRITGEVFYSLGGLVYALPILLYFGLKFTPKKAFLHWFFFIAIVLLSIGFIVKQQVYIDRNILPFLTPLVIVYGVMTDRVIHRINKNNKPNPKTTAIYSYVLVALMIFLPILGYSKNYFKKVFPSERSNISRIIEQIPNKQNKRLISIDYDSAAFQYEFPTFQTMETTIPTNGKNFNSFKVNSIGQFKTPDVVVISEKGNNKQLTTYLLPAIFNTNFQFGEHFVFYNDAEKNLMFKKLSEELNSRQITPLLKDSISIREDLVLQEINIVDGNKIYLKLDYLDTKLMDWDGCRFYFHGKAHKPDVSKLPAERVQYGFEGWDFTITENNSFHYGSSLFVYQDFNPTLMKYEKFSFGIFRGCTKSKEFSIENVIIGQN
ncbi:hypothetical protein M3P19_09720 [Muricauda sp. 2012CJ35-5]|uniref:Glycosyltransferase RgtA/B/C/D-like domain-containing protein n=1 Tax=Flagellimonas spongiicola TaxID=2942208 RepID=A0ABT0PV11_9FLAO|nr:hypothetical protein [Allomuricauda spongiicola]MCL6274288.1 hypothetical protein [Allomuricauda spongiicola]